MSRQRRCVRPAPLTTGDFHHRLLGGTADPTLIERQHLQRWGGEALASEKRDELARNRARADDDALVHYQTHWERRLKQLGRRYPERFHAPGLSPEELRDTLTLRLIEALCRPEQDEAFTLPGKEWGLLVVTSQLRELRRRFRLKAEVTDLQAVELLQHTASAEEGWLEREAMECETWAAAAAERGLTPSERRWTRPCKRQPATVASSSRVNDST